jgi:hypothetical protein
MSLGKQTMLAAGILAVSQLVGSVRRQVVE